MFEATLFPAVGWILLTLGLAWFVFGVAAGAAIENTANLSLRVRRASEAG